MTTRRKTTKPETEIDETDEEQVVPPSREFIHRSNPQGCMIPIMFVMMLGMMGFLVWDRTKPVVQPTNPVVLPSPVVDLSAFTAPITAKLAGDKAKADRVADAYEGLRDALAGAAGQRVTDSRIFESVSRAFLTDLDAKGGVSVGTEIDTAVGAYLGMTRSSDPKEPGWDPIQFDATKRARLVEIIGAIAKAAEAAK